MILLGVALTIILGYIIIHSENPYCFPLNWFYLIMDCWRIPFQQVSRTPMSTMKQWAFDTAQDFIFEKWYKMMQTCVTLTPPWDL